MSKKQHLLYTLLTVLPTVPSFVVYCSVIQSGGWEFVNWKEAITMMPIEFILAFLTAYFIGNPIAEKITNKNVDYSKTNPLVAQTIRVCATVLIMCPVMCIEMTCLYDGILPLIAGQELTLGSFIAGFLPNFLSRVVTNFPFAFFTQVFLIQPIVGWLFGKIMMALSRDKKHE